MFMKTIAVGPCLLVESWVTGCTTEAIPLCVGVHNAGLDALVVSLETLFASEGNSLFVAISAELLFGKSKSTANGMYVWASVRRGAMMLTPRCNSQSTAPETVAGKPRDIACVELLMQHN